MAGSNFIPIGKLILCMQVIHNIGLACKRVYLIFLVLGIIVQFRENIVLIVLRSQEAKIDLQDSVIFYSFQLAYFLGIAFEIFDHFHQPAMAVFPFFYDLRSYDALFRDHLGQIADDCTLSKLTLLSSY